ncbi:MAG TPA: DUF120 domain-containing protein [Candidatus Lokiarchaeia archaeon]|nr:DUF120 domain-containing protein [Candidatus Lokiarchaeia archaeon]
MQEFFVFEEPVLKKLIAQSIDKLDACMVDEKELIFLYVIAKEGALHDFVEIKSRQFVDSLGLSQQTSSRRLINLEKKGWITRQVLGKSQKIALTPVGRDKLLGLFFDLKKIFGNLEGEQVVRGELVSGLGEGAYYMGQDQYKAQFKDTLGYAPFPGTFNLVLDEVNKQLIEQLFNSRPNLRVEGFASADRTFGPVIYITGAIQNVPCAILRIERTHHENRVIEIIAPENLREKFQAADGEAFEVQID